MLEFYLTYCSNSLMYGGSAMTKSYISYEKSAKMYFINWFLFLIYELLSNALYIVCKQKYKVQSHFTPKTS